MAQKVASEKVRLLKSDQIIILASFRGLQFLKLHHTHTLTMSLKSHACFDSFNLDFFMSKNFSCKTD